MPPFFIPSILIIVASVPLVLGLVPRNRVYGIRTCKTLADDRLWYPANKFGGWALILACLAYLLLSVLVPCNGAAPGTFSVWTVHFAGFLLPLAGGIVLTLLYIRKISGAY